VRLLVDEDEDAGNEEQNGQADGVCHPDEGSCYERHGGDALSEPVNGAEAGLDIAVKDSLSRWEDVVEVKGNRSRQSESRKSIKIKLGSWEGSSGGDEMWLVETTLVCELA
jgi:hypothetical protein